MKRSRQINAQREAKRAMQEVSWSVDDPTPWPLPDMSSDGREIDTSSDPAETHEQQEVE